MNGCYRKTLTFVVLAGLTLLGACTTAPRTPQALTPDYSELGIRQVTLAPTVFRLPPLDRAYQHRIGEEILWHARKVLTAKGYRVTLRPEVRDLPFYQRYRLPSDDPRQLVALALPGSDALLVIWVDHLLDAGLYDKTGRGDLEIYATAALFRAGDGVELWRDEGYGRALSGFPWALDWFLAPADLADSLFATLPDAGAR